MNNKNVEHGGGLEIDLPRLANAVIKKIWLVILAGILGAVVTLLGTFFFVTPQYQSAAMFYVNNSSQPVGGTSSNISSGDLATARGLVDSYIVILKTRETLTDVIDHTGVNQTCEQLQKMISAESVEETEVFRVVVTSPDPYEAKKITDAIADILPGRISGIIEGASVKVADKAVVAERPCSPSYGNNTLLGFAIGLVLALGVITLRETFDITIRRPEDIGLVCTYPVLAEVPDMQAQTGSGRKKPGKYRMIRSDISFAASEAYKLLRTKLQFSFADENNCRMIGVSSALPGEGKSLTAVNLAHSFAQLNKKVLLIDCDMRRPSIHEKLSVEKTPGLSDFLTGQNDLNSLIRHWDDADGTGTLWVISSGQNPPNPIELLSSARMARLLQLLRQHYDYIILDLPPVGEVSDALAVAKQTDGFLLVVRQNYSNRMSLKAALRQFGFVDAKILGIVCNCAQDVFGDRYYKKYYEKAYGRK